MRRLRPTDLAREHGISTQAVRNYEADGFLPEAERTASGYRVYTEVHAAALRAYLALVVAYGYATGGRVMLAANDGNVDDVLLTIDRGHSRLLRDRATLESVREAVGDLVRGGEDEPGVADGGSAGSAAEPRSIGELAHLLGVTPATLRNWEELGILSPRRDPGTGYRVYEAADVRDAELAHLLRRGGYLLGQIGEVVRQVRAAGGTEGLSRALSDWRDRLRWQGLAMLKAATRLSAYLEVRGGDAEGAES
ncbi:TioE family transcriptional regulator [Phytomonospora sp. NPDC050363]|uniref:TioE family transcriptional regulator n=1 Tax=Phytomonospora sp. NPDC050363 TaxID=3155642 RepID=UPI0033DD05D9